MSKVAAEFILAAFSISGQVLFWVFMIGMCGAISILVTTLLGSLIKYKHGDPQGEEYKKSFVTGLPWVLAAIFIVGGLIALYQWAELVAK